MHASMDKCVHAFMYPCIHESSVKSMIYSYIAEIFLLKCAEKKVRYGLRRSGSVLKFYVVRLLVPLENCPDNPTRPDLMRKIRE
jgi:hypothetical protein